MRLTILGGGTAWPTPARACGGYLVEHGGTTVLLDPGHGVLVQLLALDPVPRLDAVVVSHGHLDHCADLPALLGWHAGRPGADALPVLAPAHALDDVLAAGRSAVVRRAADVVRLGDGDTVELGPLTLEAALLPHQVPTAGLRISAAGHVLACTGDSGPCQERVTLAKGADVLLAEATWADRVPAAQAWFLSSARQAARLGLAAEVGHTVLTHAHPDQAPAALLAAARSEGAASVLAASPGLGLELGSAAPAWARRANRDPVQAVPAPVPPRRAR
ncbi:Ribonuclease BN, tRNA processing enzyme [Friedmanniella luteola]|uniref:Ribonuclease BN, tRNA processing enzyme n=1 Tax=Friedmanniella luteola TaxID=546871 RepID=A0A1H1NQ38_9ACTN|nr:MBL fold metallo-hydrolase [Friedmanniella luteola]SDS01068.1 Ribonuclease BN, tRNA processing enzyme [Friedmanniella luteola]